MIYIYIFVYLYTCCMPLVAFGSRLTPISNCLSTSTSVTQDLATQATQRTRESSGYPKRPSSTKWKTTWEEFVGLLPTRVILMNFQTILDEDAIHSFFWRPFAVWLNWCCLDVVDTADTLQFHLAAWFAHLPRKSKGYSSYIMLHLELYNKRGHLLMFFLELHILVNSADQLVHLVLLRHVSCALCCPLAQCTNSRISNTRCPPRQTNHFELRSSQSGNKLGHPDGFCVNLVIIC